MSASITAMQEESLELMSGGLDRNESPLQAAQRELQEELGLRAELWADLGVINPFTTVVKSPNYMFMASDLSDAPKSPDDSEQLEVVKIRFSAALKMVMAGEITHAASCVCLLKAARLRKGKWKVKDEKWLSRGISRYVLSPFNYHFSLNSRAAHTRPSSTFTG